MVKLVTKQQINLIDNHQMIKSKMESNEISRAARPEPPKPMVRVPRNGARIRAPKPPSKKSMMAMIQNMNPPKPPPPRYTEYKQIIDRLVTGSLSSIDTGEHNARLQERISNSSDIREILTNRVLGFVEIDSDLGVLATTVAGMYLENRLANVLGS